MKQPVLTAFIPVHNGAEFLAQAISSVLAQDGPPFELLIIDDHSTDATPDIIRSFEARDGRVRSIRNPQNQGESFAANRAIEQARGRYLVRLDADDESLPDRHRLQFDVLEAGATQVVGSSVETFGARIGHAAYPLADAAIKARLLACANNIANPASAVNLAFVRASGVRYREDLRVGQDLHFWIDCMEAGASFRNIEQPLVRYRLHAAQSGKRHPGLLQQAQFEARMRVLALWFPQQSLDDRTAIARLLSSNTMTRQTAELGVAAVQRLLPGIGTSRYGEDGSWVAAYLRACLDAVIGALARPAQA